MERKARPAVVISFKKVKTASDLLNDLSGSMLKPNMIKVGMVTRSATAGEGFTIPRLTIAFVISNGMSIDREYQRR
jgi:hypothetical protein